VTTQLQFIIIIIIIKNLPYQASIKMIPRSDYCRISESVHPFYHVI